MTEHTQKSAGTPGAVEQLEALRREYVKRLPGRIGELESACRMLSDEGPDPERLHAAHRVAHSLAGSGATFGFAALSEAARVLEGRLKGWLDGEPPADAGPEHLLALLEPLRRAAEPGAQAESPVLIGSVSGRNRMVYLLEDDKALAGSLKIQLESFGYRVRLFGDTGTLEQACDAQRPDALVLDVILPEGDLAGAETAARLRERLGPEVPMVFQSNRDDIHARIAAARSGCDAYLVKPADALRLVDELERLLGRGDMEPYRILIVDDDTMLSARYALVLQQAGMEVETCDRPLAVLDRLAEGEPDLVLMDVYMPDCTGVELAKVIRQHERFLSMPIVYLSTESDLERQFYALRMGGDDFLMKPITDQRLVNAVMVRAKRARALNRLVSLDGLTGLTTHARIKERLQSEISRAARTNAPLSVAMIDIDEFKGVNDTYGHLSGDRVLRTLAQLLRRRLRRSDAVGRYGGEEFLVVFNDCDLPEALRVLDSVRDAFSGLVHRTERGEIKATFSAGVAALEPGQSDDALIHEADSALYRAKRNGRNRVETATPGS